VATGRTQLDITSYIKADGLDWGDAEFTAILAEAARGDLLVGGRLPNRTVTIPLTLRDVEGQSTFFAIRAYLQQKVGLFQREGGWVARTTDSGTLYADVVNAKLHLGGSLFQAFSGFDIDAVLTLECVPDWYGDEVDLGDNVELTNPELVFTDSGIAGNYPGRVRLVVDNDQSGFPQRALLWGVRSRNYSSASTAALAYATTALTLMDSAANSGGVVKHTNLAPSWTPVVSTNVGGTAWLTHTGAYRVWANIGSTLNGSQVSTRFVWDVGDLTLPVENSAVTLPGNSGYYLVDLGEVYLQKVPSGSHRWQGIIQCKGAVGGEDVEIKRLWFQPLDESSGRLIAPAVTVRGTTAFVARSTFGQSPATLNNVGLDAPSGTTWATSTAGSGGSTTDFYIPSDRFKAVRDTTLDTFSNFSHARFAVAGANILPTYVSCQVGYHSNALAGRQGVVARFLNLNFFIIAYWDTANRLVRVLKRISGVDTFLGTVSLGASDPGPAGGDGFDVNATIGLAVLPDGKWSLLWTPSRTGSLQEILTGYDSALPAVGGSLGAGKVGLFDSQTGSGGLTYRAYSQFEASSPPSDAVVFDSRSLELRTDGAFRADSAGAAYAPVARQLGDLPRIPPSGMEGRTVQTFLKGSRGDLVDADVGTDDISARLFYRPSYLYVGGTA
jgi:hypothetical protein